MKQPHNNPASVCNDRKDIYIAAVLVFCLFVVGFWEIMSNHSDRAWGAFQLTAEDFQDFEMRSEGWEIVQKKTSPSPTEPEILKYDLSRSAGGNYQPVITYRNGLPVGEANVTRSVLAVRSRLVHGYNMVDCMRIKGYSVKPIAAPVADEFPYGSVQLWALENSVGDRSVWATSMLRAGDFAVLDIATTEMLFPRIGVPDNPEWLPQGLTWKSLRHPIKNIRAMLRAKWNASRCDPMVFLKLKQPPWANDEILTLVSNSLGIGPSDKKEEVVYITQVLEAHSMLYKHLRDHKTQ